MDSAKKRERSENFTREETERLISLIEAYKNIIENKKSNAVTWQQKEKAWRAIAAEYNSPGVGTFRFRNAKNLKIKYEALKRDARKKTVIREKRCQAGSGVNDAPSFTPAEQKVQDMLSSFAEGGEGITYDSDQQGKPKENRSLEKLIERKLEVAVLQKKMIEEEMEEKMLKMQMLKNEMQYKNELYTLEREERLLKIEILKTELENKKKLY